MNEENDKPGYWAVLTADIRYDKNLKPSEKLLYAEITALQKMNGYCYASNAYFEKVFDASERSVKYWLKSLEEKGHISIKYIYKEGSKEIDKRIITTKVKDDVQGNALPSAKNCTTRGAKNCTDISNPYSTDIINKKKEIVCSIEHTKENPMESLFEVFWSKYPKKQKKKDARVAFLRNVSESNAKKVFDGLEMWLKSEQWSKDHGRYIPLPTSWLNEERWNDELKTSEIKDGGIEEFLAEDDDDDIFGTRKGGHYIDADFTAKA